MRMLASEWPGEVRNADWRRARETCHQEATVGKGVFYFDKGNFGLYDRFAEITFIGAKPLVFQARIRSVMNVYLEAVYAKSVEENGTIIPNDLDVETLRVALTDNDMEVVLNDWFPGQAVVDRNGRPVAGLLTELEAAIIDDGDVSVAHGWKLSEVRSSGPTANNFRNRYPELSSVIHLDAVIPTATLKVDGIIEWIRFFLTDPLPEWTSDPIKFTREEIDDAYALRNRILLARLSQSGRDPGLEESEGDQVQSRDNSRSEYPGLSEYLDKFQYWNPPTDEASGFLDVAG